MVKDKDKVFIECECADRCSIITLEYLEDYNEFNLNLYRLYSFKRKKEIYGVTFSKVHAEEIIEYLQKRHVGYKYRIYFEYKSANFSGGLKIEWIGDLNMFLLTLQRKYKFVFVRKYMFNRNKDVLGITFSEDQSQQIIDFLQNKLIEEVSS